MGKGALTLTCNGTTSGQAKIQVAGTTFGGFTLSQSGNGRAVIQKPAVAGQVAILYGTGLGPADFDESRPPQAKDIRNNVQVFVGGLQANVVYHGSTRRSRRH